MILCFALLLGHLITILGYIPFSSLGVSSCDTDILLRGDKSQSMRNSALEGGCGSQTPGYSDTTGNLKGEWGSGNLAYHRVRLCKRKTILPHTLKSLREEIFLACPNCLFLVEKGIYDLLRVDQKLNTFCRKRSSRREVYWLNPWGLSRYLICMETSRLYAI